MSGSSDYPASSAGSDLPRVSLIIPHLRGEAPLRRCLESVGRHTPYPRLEVVLVDNGSRDGSVEAVRGLLPGLRVLTLAENRGFAGGCNHGIRCTEGEYVVLLNDDTEVTPGWLEGLVAAAEASPDVAACQSKLLALLDRGRFEYSGAAGGLMDIFAFPFSWGRVFDVCEPDHGQYEREVDIFWAAGAAILFRRAALEQVGLFDEVFHSFMEEIDLCWRLHLSGRRVIYAPRSVVYHLGSYSQAQRDFRKMYFNHRNSVLMLIKNYALPNLLWALPGRLFLELLLIGAAPLRNPLRSLAALQGLAWVLSHPAYLLRRRREVRRLRRVGDRSILRRLYLGSIALEYFVFRRTRVDRLLGYRRLRRWTGRPPDAGGRDEGGRGSGEPEGRGRIN